MTKISELKFDDQNFNNHTEYGMSLLEKSLRENGAGRSILIDKDNRIIAGNGIVEAAGSIGMDNVEIVDITGEKIVALRRKDITLDSKKGREMAMADNSTAAADLSWNKGAIAKQKEKWGIDPNAWGITDWKDKPEEITEDEAPAVSDESAKSVLGGVYQLGGHRLMCGDSTDSSSVAILMAGQKVDLVFTDPPYGINVVSDDGKVGADFGVAKKGQYSKVIADDTTDTAQKAYVILKDLSKRLIIWGGNYFTSFLDFSDGWLVWDKRGDSGIRNTFADGEMAWCSFHTPVRIYRQLWNGMIRQGEHEKRVHPTQKPLKIIEEILQDFTKKDEVILDVFGGSGSTLIACEQLGRRCFMMELDPKYCDVIRKRYWRFTHNGDETGWGEGTPAI